MSNRTVRVNELVQRELSDILRQRYQSESVAITITEVRVSGPNFRGTRVCTGMKYRSTPTGLMSVFMSHDPYPRTYRRYDGTGT